MTAGLKNYDKDIKRVYDTDSCDMTQILNLLLGEADRYNRIGSYFSSKSFIPLAEGLSKFIEGNGKFRLIINYQLEEEDYGSIKKILDNKELGKSIEIDIKNLRSEIERDSAKVLGWLIYEGRLELKVVTGRVHKLLHTKTGIIEDQYGNKIAFSGSANETYMGYIGNIEQIVFFKDWDAGQKEYVEDLVNNFEKFWLDRGIDAKTYEIKEAFEKELIRIRPNEKNEAIALAKKLCTAFRSKEKEEVKHSKPWPHQEEAVENWLKNGKRGIIEMPTGCGKTKTAIFCYEKVEERPLITFIFAPTRTICKQWANEFKEKNENICNIFSNQNWKKEMDKQMTDIRVGASDKLVIIGTYKLMNHPKILSAIDTTGVTTMLIADEVHSAGADKTTMGLSENYKYRLGLSATPKRWMDDEGTEKVFEYFGDVVFDKITLFDAIYKLNVLSEYNYHVIHAILNDEEMTQYEDLTNKISNLYRSKDKGITDFRIESIIQRLLEKRANIIKNCESKLEKFKELSEKIDLSKTIIFVSPQQRKKINEILSKKVMFHQYTFSETEEERNEVLSNFKAGRISCIVAIKCLDEGLDVPSAKKAIILASSGNPREFIQRRGRILRKHGDKIAELYDFFVTPSVAVLSHSDKYIKQIEKEMGRIKEFAHSAKNEMDVSKTLKEIKDYLGI
jgi:superfamily II DNA or RNA helicase